MKSFQIAGFGTLGEQAKITVLSSTTKIGRQLERMYLAIFFI